MNIIVKAIATTTKIIVILILALVIVGAVGLAIVYQQHTYPKGTFPCLRKSLRSQSCIKYKSVL